MNKALEELTAVMAAASWMGLAVAVAVAGGLAWSTVPLWRAWFIRNGWVDEPGPRKPHHGIIPLAGGLALLAGWVAGVLGSRMLDDNGVPPAGDHGWVLLAGSILMGLLGWWDDVRDLTPAPKLAGQLLILAGTVALGVRVPWWADWPWLQAGATILFLLVGLNAVNFLDNMNGLCAGLGAIGGAMLAGLAALDGRRDLCALGLGLAAACGGVLPWNFPRARVFIGDTGSHVVGYLLCGLVLENWAGQAVAGAGGVVAPVCAMAVPLADFVQVTFRRWRRGQALWTGDTTHLSHELARRGLGPVGAVVVLWAAAALAGSVGLALRFWAAH